MSKLSTRSFNFLDKGIVGGREQIKSCKSEKVKKWTKILFDKIGESIIIKSTQGSLPFLINIKFETHQMCSPRSLNSADRSPRADNLDCSPLVLFVCNLLLLREGVL